MLIIDLWMRQRRDALNFPRPRMQQVATRTGSHQLLFNFA
jgi:hypothetical protein